MVGITLNQIISYLSSENYTKDTKIKSLILDKNEIEHIDDLNLFRLGITQFKNNKFNISLYSSILYNIDENFSMLNDNEQLSYIDNFINKIIFDINDEKLFAKFNYKSNKIKKQDLINDISYYKNTNKVIRFLSDYFYINIFVWSIENNELSCMYGEEEFNKYKKSIFIANIDNHSYEPIRLKNQINFTYNDNFLINLLNTKQDQISTFYSKLFTIRTDDKINLLDQEKELNNDLADEPNNDKEKKIKFSIKMKLGELQNLATKFGINYKKNVNNKLKNKTKADLINDLDKYNK